MGTAKPFDQERDIVKRPLFSILLPSRNRLELLRLAVASTAGQDFSDLEVVISDNASEPSYADFVAGIRGLDVVYLRSEVPLSVTENWTRTLEAAHGRYIIMLGDDDALTPGYLALLKETIERFSEPDFIYVKAYHYAYPGVFADRPDGYFCALDCSPLFGPDKEPYLLDVKKARDLGADVLKFRHNVSFNAQHFVWSSDYIGRTSIRPFFQAPYPDYFACMVSFLTAERIVVVPTAEVVIGISKQSFGFYYFNGREEEGAAQFMEADVEPEDLVGGMDGARQALGVPGSAHYRNWLLSALRARHALRDRLALQVDLGRYHQIQAFELSRKRGSLVSLSWPEILQRNEGSSPFSRTVFRARFAVLKLLDRMNLLPRRLVSRRRMRDLRIYHSSRAENFDIGPHRDIMDAFRWLKGRLP